MPASLRANSRSALARRFHVRLLPGVAIFAVVAAGAAPLLYSLKVFSSQADTEEIQTLAAEGRSTSIRIEGASRDEVARTLWQTGGRRSKADLFGHEPVRVWPSPKAIDKDHAIFRYRLDHICGAFKEACVDHVYISSEGNRAIIVSLRCENQATGLGAGVPGRDKRRERRVLQETAWRLEKAGVTISGVGGWLPAGKPVIASAHGARWLAYRGGSTKPAADYFRYRRYEKLCCSADRVVYARELHDNPWKTAFLFDKGTWKSRETVIVKTVQPVERSGQAPVVVVGAIADGHEYFEENSLFGLVKRTDRDLDEVLPRRVLDTIALSAAIDTEHLEFISPLPWVEPINLPSWQKVD